MSRFAWLRHGLMLLVVLSLAGLSVARADDVSSQPPPKPPAIEPKAIALLRETSDRLASAKTLAFVVQSTFESPSASGQPLYYTLQHDVLLQRPNKLRVITPGDGPVSEFYFDGQTATAFAPAEGLAAVDEIPGSIDNLVTKLYEKAAIFYPFEDAIVSDPYTAMMRGIISAFVVGQSHVVADTTTYMIALAGDDVQVELWIGAEDKLPRLVRAVRPNDPGKPYYELAFLDWRLDAPAGADDFMSPRAARAPRMPFARPDAPLPAKPDAPLPAKP